MSVRDNYECEGQMSMFDLYDLDTWYGKTSPEHSAVTKEKTLGAYSKKFAELKIKMPQYLCLRGGAGVQAVASWGMDIQWLGGYTMRSFGESPSEERESHLSQILEDHPHPKYCLSAKACQGILRRAESRGKELPEILKKALIRQSASKNEQESPGGGKGILIQNDHVGALSTLNNQKVAYSTQACGDRDNPSQSYLEETAYTLPSNPMSDRGQAVCTGQTWDGKDVCSTLTANNASGAQRMPDKDNFNAVIVLNDQGGMMVVSMATKQLSQNIGEDVAMPICANDYKEPQVVCLEGNGSRESHKGNGYKESETMYTLNTVEQHSVCYGIDRAAFNQGKNAQFGFSVQEDMAQTIVAKGPGGL